MLVTVTASQWLSLCVHQEGRRYQLGDIDLRKHEGFEGNERWLSWKGASNDSILWLAAFSNRMTHECPGTPNEAGDFLEVDQGEWAHLARMGRR